LNELNNLTKYVDYQTQPQYGVFYLKKQGFGDVAKVAIIQKNI
jgi:hypothetical protein